jgi:hypothetical protein
MTKIVDEELEVGIEAHIYMPTVLELNVDRELHHSSNVMPLGLWQRFRVSPAQILQPWGQGSSDYAPTLTSTAQGEALEMFCIGRFSSHD